MLLNLREGKNVTHVTLRFCLFSLRFKVRSHRSKHPLYVRALTLILASTVCPSAHTFSIHRMPVRSRLSKHPPYVHALTHTYFTIYRMCVCSHLFKHPPYVRALTPF